MPNKDKGNEKIVIQYLFNNQKTLNLNGIGAVKKLEIPLKNQLIDITNLYDSNKFANDDANKKADIFINGIGISIKEKSSVLYNKWQRKNAFDLLNLFNPTKVSTQILQKLDKKVSELNQGLILRDVNASQIMTNKQLSDFLEYTMFIGSANHGKSSFPAQYVLIAPKKISSPTELEILNFNQFFKKYKNNIVFALRRCWYGQKSNSEHNRASGMINDLLNKPWVYNNISGQPRGWKPISEVPIIDRKEVFYINVILKV
jgi:hypothetical protein